MSLLSLRTFDDPFYSMITNLDGTDYLFEFRYNQREDCWYFDLSLTDGTLLVAGIKVVCNRPLLRKFVDTRLPPGTLIALSNTTDASPPGLEELGEDRRVTLIYSPFGEDLSA